MAKTAITRTVSLALRAATSERQRFPESIPSSNRARRYRLRDQWFSRQPSTRRSSGWALRSGSTRRYLRDLRFAGGCRWQRHHSRAGRQRPRSRERARAEDLGRELIGRRLRRVAGVLRRRDVPPRLPLPVPNFSALGAKDPSRTAHAEPHRLRRDRNRRDPSRLCRRYVRWCR